jgi:hypothetical protein
MPALSTGASPPQVRSRRSHLLEFTTFNTWGFMTSQLYALLSPFSDFKFVSKKPLLSVTQSFVKPVQGILHYSLYVLAPNASALVHSIEHKSVFNDARHTGFGYTPRRILILEWIVTKQYSFDCRDNPVRCCIGLVHFWWLTLGALSSQSTINLFANVTLPLTLILLTRLRYYLYSNLHYCHHLLLKLLYMYNQIAVPIVSFCPLFTSIPFPCNPFTPYTVITPLFFTSYTLCHIPNCFTVSLSCDIEP